MLLDDDINVSAVHDWCVTNGITTATVNGIVYRGAYPALRRYYVTG
jgi:hypothetical protein